MIVHTFEVNKPIDKKVTISSTMATLSGARAKAGRVAAQISKPDTANVFRAQLDVAPFAIHASEIHPAAVDAAPHKMNGSPPKTAILCREKCRSMTR